MNTPIRSARAVLFAAALGTSCTPVPAPSAALVERRAAYGAEDPGAQGFLFGEFSALSAETLQAQAMPWKLAATGLLLFRNPDDAPFTEQGALQLLRRYGLFVPKRIANWPERTPAPTPRHPLGLVSGQLALGPGFTLEVAAVGCAGCHAARGYDANGQPTDEVWLGAPNTSFDAEGWGRDLFASLHELSRMEATEVVAQVRRAFPELTDDEERGIRVVYLSQLRKRTAALEDQASFVDFHRGRPGMPDAVAALEWMLAVPQADAQPPAPASIPALFALARPAGWWDGHFTAGGGKAAPPAGPCAVAHLGVPPAAAAQETERLAATVRAASRARPPPFPGEVDELLARDGERLFRAACASCHGTYDGSTRPARPKAPPSPTPADVGTDGLRLERGSATLSRAWNGSAARPAAEGRSTRGYLAPGLSGIWASAPYLHNGSVPSLAALLDPALRPARFLVGGHGLDFGTVGISHAPGDATRYPDRYSPWSAPVLYDTAEPGQGRDGHVTQVQSLTSPERRALLEYLKTL